MKHTLLGTAAAVALMFTAAVAQAAPGVNFASGPGSASAGVTSLSFSGGNVTATGYSQVGGTGAYSPTTLWLRNQTNDHGLGVCSEGTSSCSSGGGDQNELSQLVNNEAILLTIASTYSLTGLWLSSLDANGGGGVEDGRVYYANSFVDVGSMISSASSTTFTYPAFGGTAVEGELSGVPLGYQYYLFVPGADVGANNDYLVWGVDITAVPEPASLALLGAGLLGLGLARRRRRA